MMQATFSYSEDWILGCDEMTREMVVWDTRTAQIHQRWRGKLDYVVSGVVNIYLP